MKRISLYFAQGLLVLLPLIGTFYILAFIYSKIAGLGKAILFPLVGRVWPGIDFIFVIVRIPVYPDSDSGNIRTVIPETSGQ